ncbi:hypothetical protein [Amycolatopsis sp. NPDC051372]|uniref:hypothetical protein n=1 Tax=Amycolatopsis sp. NPDC051372 TaxID=3155669 RepID=UPI00341CA868
MIAADLRRSWSHAVAVALGHAWRTCAGCGRGFSDRENPTTGHIETIPGGEDDNRLLCPTCTDAGVGCRAHGGVWWHEGCEYVSDAEVWPADDADEEPHRSGPYRMTDAPTNPNLRAVVSAALVSAEAADWSALREYSSQIVPPVPSFRVVSDRPGRGPDVFIPMRSRDFEVLRRVLDPSPEEVAETRTRAQEREARRADERQAVLDRHRDVLAAIPDVDQNVLIRDLLRAHAPVLGGAGELECRGCAQVPGWDSEDGEYEARWPEAPCPTWTTITRLHADGSSPTEENH